MDLWGAMGTPSGSPRVQPASTKSALNLYTEKDRKLTILGVPGEGEILRGAVLQHEFWPLWHPWEGFPPARELISGLFGFCRPLWVRVS